MLAPPVFHISRHGDTNSISSLLLRTELRGEDSKNITGQGSHLNLCYCKLNTALQAVGEIAEDNGSIINILQDIVRS